MTVHAPLPSDLPTLRNLLFASPRKNTSAGTNPAGTKVAIGALEESINAVLRSPAN